MSSGTVSPFKTLQHPLSLKRITPLEAQANAQY